MVAEYVLFFLLTNGSYGKFDTDRQGRVTNVYTKKAGEKTARLTEKKEWERVPDTSSIMAYIREISPKAGVVLDRLRDYNVSNPEVGIADVKMDEKDASRMLQDWKGSIEVYKLGEIKFVH